MKVFSPDCAQVCTATRPRPQCSHPSSLPLTASRLFSAQRLSPLKASSDGDKPSGSGTTSTRPPEKPASDGPIKSSADQRKDQESPPSQSPEQKDKKPDSSKPKPDVVSPLLFQMASGRRRSPPTEMVFAGLGAYTGLVGSAAIALAWGAHIDLFNSFRWEAADIQTALQYIIPLQVLNAAILLPNYSSWSLTDNTDSSMAGLKMQLAAVKARSSALSGSAAEQGSSSTTPTPMLPVVSSVNPLRTINDGMNLAQVSLSLLCLFLACASVSGQLDYVSLSGQLGGLQFLRCLPYSIPSYVELTHTPSGDETLQAKVSQVPDSLDYSVALFTQSCAFLFSTGFNRSIRVNIMLLL